MQGCAQGGLMLPYAIVPSVSLAWCTAGSWIAIPIPDGTLTGVPFKNTSRCEWTWRKTNSCVSGVSPALRVSFIGSDGGRHGTAPFVGVGAGLAGGAAAFFAPQPARHSTRRHAHQPFIRGTLSAVPAYDC